MLGVDLNENISLAFYFSWIFLFYLEQIVRNFFFWAGKRTSKNWREAGRGGQKELSIWMLMFLINNLSAKCLLSALVSAKKKIIHLCLRFWLHIDFLSSFPYILWCDVVVCHFSSSSHTCLLHFFFLSLKQQHGKLNFKNFFFGVCEKARNNWLLATAGVCCTLKCFNVRQKYTGAKSFNFFSWQSLRRSTLSCCKFVQQFRSLAQLHPAGFFLSFKSTNSTIHLNLLL